MKRVLVTGMSGTGKSTTIRELAARGYKAVDADDPGWSEQVRVPGEPDGPSSTSGFDWVWREDRIAALLATDDADILFLSGCAPNQARFYPQFDHIVLLSTPTPVMIERLRTRTTNAFGKRPDELVKVLEDTLTIEPLLRRRASLEVPTTAPVDAVVEAILAHAGFGPEPSR